jgi:hypothetical protein
MGEKYLALAVGLALLFFTAGIAAGQPAPKAGAGAQDEANQLGENFAITLVLEKAQLKESFTIVTAMEGFQVETQVGKGEERINLGLEGRIIFKERQLVIGERRVETVKPILVRYRINMHGPDDQKDGGLPFGLDGSAYLEENKEIAIVRTTNMTLKLKISRL